MIEDPISKLISRWFRSAHSLKNDHFRKKLCYLEHPLYPLNSHLCVVFTSTVASIVSPATPNGFGHPYWVTHRLCLSGPNMNRLGNRPYRLMGYDTQKCKTSMSKTTTPLSDFQDVAGRKLFMSIDSSQDKIVQQKTLTRTKTAQLHDNSQRFQTLRKRILLHKAIFSSSYLVQVSKIRIILTPYRQLGIFKKTGLEHESAHCPLCPLYPTFPVFLGPPNIQTSSRASLQDINTAFFGPQNETTNNEQTSSWDGLWWGVPVHREVLVEQLNRPVPTPKEILAIWSPSMFVEIRLCFVLNEFWSLVDHTSSAWFTQMPVCWEPGELRMDSVQKANETSCGLEGFFSDSTQLTPAQLSAFNKGQPAMIINRHPPDLQHHHPSSV